MKYPPPAIVMPLKRPLPWVCLCIAAVLLAASLAPVRALAADAVNPPGGSKAVAAGPVNPGKPTITRWNLKPEETAATMRFEVNLKMRNLPELGARIARGERIPPQEMAAKYDPLASDYDSVAAWLTGKGFSITRRDQQHMALFAQGTVAQIQAAMQVTFARVTLEGKEYTSAVSTPNAPPAIAPLLVGVNGLQPEVRMHRHLIWRQATPDESAGNASYYPQQIAEAYGVTGLYGADLKGSGQSIAIIIDTFPATSDLVAFWKDAGVNQSLANIQFIQAVSGTLPDPSGEETLDTEWSSSMAPGARVRVYAATDLLPQDLDAAYAQVVDDVTNHPEYGIHQMSMSYGIGEPFTSGTQVTADDQFFMQLAGLGVTIFASSGDDGATPGPDGTGDNSGGRSAESPASDPYVTGVGGTTLQLSSNNTTTSETVWNSNGGASGGGTSKYFARPTWQTGTGVVAGTNREVPDIAGSADPDYGAVIVQGGSVQTVGGTSWSSPTWAGMCALINQARANSGQAPLGVLGPHIYPLLNATDYPTNYLANFNDITSGNNTTSSVSGFSATAGYDLCTGLGSPHASLLAQLLINSITLVGVQSPNPIDEVTPGKSAAFSVGVGGASATYQWQILPVGSTSWSNLSDSGTFTGSAGSTLSIAGATTAMSGDQFQCLVTVNSNVITTTPPSALIVDTPLTVSTLAGEASVSGLQNARGTGAQFNYPSGVATDSSGNVYVADYGNNQIREIAPNGQVSTPYGDINGFSGFSNGNGNSATFNAPNAVAIDGSNNIYVADSLNNKIRKITNGTVSTLAGSFNAPEGVAVDASGNVYVADSGNNVIRKVTSGGAVSILAGQVGVAGFANGAATTQAEFNNPIGVAVDGSGNVFVADFGNSVVREISGGTVTTAAGIPEVNGWLDGVGATALFNGPIGVSVDGIGNVYIADSQVPADSASSPGNCLVRKLSTAGVVSTLAGQPGLAGAVDATGTSAEFYSVQDVTVTGSGQFYMADTYNQIIRSGTAAGIITSSSSSIISLSGDLAFGEVVVGESNTSTMTITNPGDAPLNVTGISYPDGFSGNWSSGVIATGSSQNVTVVFAPTVVTSYGGSIVVTSNAAAGSNAITASGIGVAGVQPPSVQTASVSIVTDTSALLNGAVNPEGSPTSVYFQYGTDTTYSSGTTASSAAGSGATSESFSAPIAGLKPATVYHYQAVATSGTFTSYGNDETFTTLSFANASIAYAGETADDVTGAAFAVFGNPAINALDEVAFEATLGLAAGVVTPASNGGIWAQDSTGTRHLVIRTGDIAPGTNGALFSAFSNPVYNDNEAVAFLGALRVIPGEDPALTSQGIWSTSSGALALVAQRGTQAAGYPTGVNFSSFSTFALPDQGGVILYGAVSARTNNRGIWAGDSAADLQLLVKVGDAINGRTITALSVLPTLSFVDGQSRSFAQTTGQLVCLATFGKEGTGILEITGTNVASLGLSGSAAPGVSGGYFSAFGNPVINASGDVAFRATLDPGLGGVIAASNAGIWADDSTGALDLIARTSGTAPGTNGVFATLSDPVYNDNSAVAFRGTLRVAAGQATPSTAAGIWANNGGSLALVARQGGQAPGCPTGATFSAFTSIALPDQGGVVMLAGLNANRAAGVNAANNLGIWAVDTAGNLQLIARKGSVMNGKTVTAISFLPILPDVTGQTRNFNYSTGDLAYLVTFTDKTTAIFVVTF